MWLIPDDSVVSKEIIMFNVVLVIDMVKGFLEPGHNLFCGADARTIIPNIQELLSKEASAGSGILFINDNHEVDDLEFNIFPVHCVKGTSEPDVIPELVSFITAQNVIPKTRYSGFFNTDLEQRLSGLKPDKLIICGVCTDICVLHTTSDARNRDYNVEIPKDCVASYDVDAHQWALSHASNILGANVT